MDPTFGDVMARHCTLTCKRCDDVEFEDEYGDNFNVDYEHYSDVITFDNTGLRKPNVEKKEEPKAPLEVLHICFPNF
ncbi:hypothetical protein TELCIR_03495 [Teladorsagia circumcincta]|uniref:Uncharacterized protein n=1 Tax=Teladorsagia circumcincta TaxID=45464 RepID=A0A2G9UW63_TELCI|nr:hypothetical protein TELCIR_03495 [Teladorsagia circumcincta]